MFDQIAVVSRDLSSSIDRAKAGGLKEWTRDTVTAKAIVAGEPCEFRAHLGFNYDILNGGVEFEFIQPLTDHHYMKLANTPPGGIAHAGIHVADDDEAEKWISDLMLETVLQDCKTVHHSNAAVPDDRSYHYTIWWTTLFPFPVKLIKRITREEALRG